MSRRFVGLNLQRYLFLGHVAIDMHSISFDQNSKHGDKFAHPHKISSSLEMRAAKKYMQFAAVEVISKAIKEAEERKGIV